MVASSIFAPVIESLNAGAFVEAETRLLGVLRVFRDKPGLPSLFRAGQERGHGSGNGTSLAAIREAVLAEGHPALTSLWETVAGRWQGPTAYMRSAEKADMAQWRFLFEDRSDNVLNIAFKIPITVCNYRCSYCFLSHQAKTDAEILRLMPAILAQLGRIPRPLAVEMLPLGDIIAVPAMWPLYENLAALSNLASVEVWSNLSRDLDGFLKYLPPEKVRIIGTYHPTEFKHPDKDKESFFHRVEVLRDRVSDITINMAASSSNLPHYAELKERLDTLRVYMTINPLQGRLNGDGKSYPEDYSRLDRANIRNMMKNDFLGYFMLDALRTGVRCSAGRDYIEIDHEGKVFRCGPLTAAYGNMLDAQGPLIDSGSRYCPLGGCSCKAYIGYIEPCVAEYKRIGTKHHFIKRPDGDIGSHSYDPII